MHTYTDRFDSALAYASRLHREQKRKGSGVAYISHLLGVAAIAIENGVDEDQAIAALLHDAVEDQGGLTRLAEIRELYGDAVADIVADCTDDFDETKDRDVCPAARKAEWRARKEKYLKSLETKPERSLQVSLADKTHNASAINADLRAHGEEVWNRFKGGKDGTLWYYRSLAAILTKRVSTPASARFAREVAEMEELASRA